MKTSTLLGIFTGLALVNPFAAGLQAMAEGKMAFPGSKLEMCHVQTADGAERVQLEVDYNGPQQPITIDGIRLQPTGGFGFRDGNGNTWTQERAMDNLVLLVGGARIECTLNQLGA